MITYSSKYLPRTELRSFVISQDQTRLGAVASNSGFLLAGWVRWRRRSRFSPAVVSSRYMVEIEHR